MLILILVKILYDVNGAIKITLFSNVNFYGLHFIIKK